MTDQEVLDVVAQSIRETLRTYCAHVAFQQVRTAPESLIVHFSAFQLQTSLQRRWPGRFRVHLEEGRRYDLQLNVLGPGEPPFIFEFKVPWSGNLIASKIADDIVTAADLEPAVRQCLARKTRYLVAQPMNVVEPIRLETDEAQIECSVTLWHPRSHDAPEV